MNFYRIYNTTINFSSPFILKEIKNVDISFSLFKIDPIATFTDRNYFSILLMFQENFSFLETYFSDFKRIEYDFIAYSDEEAIDYFDRYINNLEFI